MAKIPINGNPNLGTVERDIATDLATLKPSAISAATYAAPAAPAALTSAAAAGAAPDKAEFDKTVVDIAALRTALVATNAKLAALAVDVADIRTKLNAVAGGTILTTNV